MKFKIRYLALVLAAAGCKQNTAKAVVIPTATIQRRDIVVLAEANGSIEPINVIEVKSKTASGQVLTMPVDFGTYLKPGDLVVQIDTAIAHMQLSQNISDLAASKANFDVATAVLKRQQQLYNDKVITKPDLETAQTAFATAQAQLLRNQAARDLTMQSIQDATVQASVAGTIITKPVSVGQVVQAGATSANGGTVIATMADLTKVRARAFVNETDIAGVKPGQEATVTVDAIPDRPFTGTVERIDPQATVQQNVTMFPVLINLDNQAGLLKPGMNGEIQILTDERPNAIALPNDAIRSPREATVAATILGLNPDSVRAQLRGGGGARGGARNGGGVQVQVGRGELASSLVDQGGGGQGGGQGGSGRGGNRQQITVTDADCKKVDVAFKKKPGAQKKIDDLRAKMRSGGDRQAMQADMKKAYADLGLDAQVAGACARKAGGRGGDQQLAGGADAAAGGGARRGGGGRGGRGGRGGGGVDANGNPRQTADRGLRSGLVFVQTPTGWQAKNVRLGVANYDYTEVLDDGLKEGDKVALLSAATMQANRQAAIDKQKAQASPLGGGAAPAGGARGGGRGG